MATAAEGEKFPAPLSRLLLPANGRSHMTSFCVVKILRKCGVIDGSRACKINLQGYSFRRSSQG